MPAPLWCKKAEFSAPHSLAQPAWIHMIPNQTRIANQATAATFDSLSQSQTGGLVRCDGLPSTSVTFVMGMLPSVSGPVPTGLVSIVTVDLVLAVGPKVPADRLNGTSHRARSAHDVTF